MVATNAPTWIGHENEQRVSATSRPPFQSEQTGILSVLRHLSAEWLGMLICAVSPLA